LKIIIIIIIIIISYILALLTTKCKSYYATKGNEKVFEQLSQETIKEINSA
jgi:hypothetical protein